MLSALHIGDKIILSGGLIGKITKLNSEKVIEIELSNSMQIQVLRSAVDSKMP